MEVMMRKDVPVEMTWDLSLLYKKEEDVWADAELAAQMSKEIAGKYLGTLNRVETIDACMSEMQEMNRLFYLSVSYAELAASVDYYDAHAQSMHAAIRNLIAEAESRLSFVEAEISRNEAAVLDEAIAYAQEKKSGNACWLKDILRKKPHQLPAETENVLAALSPVMSAPEKIYNMAKLADTKFPSFTVNGKEYPLSYALFEEDYEYVHDTDVRRSAFAAFSKEIAKYENVTAAAYNTYVTTDRIMAKLRGFKDTFDYLLFSQKVTREMYDRQIDLITEKLAPHMRRYAKLIQKIYGLEEMTYADLMLSIDPEYTPKITIEESKKYKTWEEFFWKSPAAHNSARRHKWADEMTWLVRKQAPQSFWQNEENVIEESKKYSTKTEFFKGCHAAYDYAKKHNLWDKMPWIKTTIKESGYWTKERVLDEGKKYSTKKDFLNNAPTAYSKANKYHWMDEMTWFQSDVKPQGYWQIKQNVIEESKKYSSRVEFRWGLLGPTGLQ